MYWAWKNIKCLYPNLEYIGLNHYRRYFAYNSKKMFADIIGKKEDEVIDYVPNVSKLNKIFTKYSAIIAKEVSFDNSLANQYCYNLISEDYRQLIKTIKEYYPEYEESLYHVFECNNKFSACNMFVMRYDLFDNYCKWIFGIAKYLEEKIPYAIYSEEQKRGLGCLAERLLNVYIYHNKINVKKLPVYFYNNNYTNINAFIRLKNKMISDIKFDIIKPHRVKTYSI
jgi:hypothetical protein